MSKGTKFSIVKGRKYLITEKPTPNTPVELQKVGRSKQGGGFFEFADIPYDEDAKKYDTGLDKTSREFIGKSDAEIDKILNEDRKELVNYHNNLLRGEKDEVKVVAANRLKIKHNLIIDTNNIADYYKLFLAMRGNKLTPVNDKGNLVRAKTSMYQISDESQEVNHIKELAEKRMKAEQWLYARIGNSPNRKQALEYLRYEKILNLNQDKDDALLLDMFKRNMENYEKLVSFLHLIESVSEEDVYMSNDVSRLIMRNVIRKEKANYVYDGVVVGLNVQDIVRNLKKEEFAEIALKLFNNNKKVEKK